MHRNLTYVGCIILIVLGVHVGGCRHGTEASSTIGADIAPPASQKGQTAQGPELMVKRWNKEKSPLWAAVDTLEQEHKLDAALKETLKLLPVFRDAGDSQELVNAYLRISRYNHDLGRVEQGIKSLYDAQWPDDLLSQTARNLELAHRLTNYSDRVYVGIVQANTAIKSQRSRDFTTWSRTELCTEVNRLYQTIWLSRKQLGMLPRDALFDYLKLGTYPEEIRGTMRDVVVYLWASWLSNSRFWRAEHASEAYQLDLASLTSRQIDTVNVVDSTLHPLLRLSWLLNEHQQWHLAQNRIGAGLEAYLVRLQALFDQFDDQKKREMLIDVLRRKLDQVTQDSWWTQGMLQLATFEASIDKPDAKVKARLTAKACQTKFPKTSAAKNCMALVQHIELPEWRVEAMISDAPGRPSIALHYRNIREIKFSAWSIDLEKITHHPGTYPLSIQQYQELISARAPLVTWTERLTETTDFRFHRHYVTNRFTEYGDYLVVAHVGEPLGDDLKQMAILHIGNIVVGQRNVDGKLEVRVSTGQTGEPITSARVRIFSRDRYDAPPKLITTRTTDRKGRAVFVPGQGQLHRNYFTIIDHPTYGRVYPDPIYLTNNHRYRDRNEHASVFTDRSIYRPGQTVHWQAIAHSPRNTKGDITVRSNKLFAVELRDANDEVVKKITRKSNRFGTLAGTFEVPNDRLLGSWNIRVYPSKLKPYMVNQMGGTISVEAYKRPTFETKLSPLGSPARLNRTTTITGESKYYFGAPVTNGAVKWRVKRWAQYPDWWRWYWVPRVASQLIAHGQSSLDTEGKFTFKFMPTADESLDPEQGKSVYYRYEVSVDVTDDGGETRSGSRQFTLGFSSIKATLSTENNFQSIDKDSVISIRRTNLDDEAAPGVGTWVLRSLKQPKTTPLPHEVGIQPKPQAGALILPGDRLRPRYEHGYRTHERLLNSWRDGAEISSGTVKHSSSGVADLNLGKLEPGAYRIRYRSTDAFDKPYTTFKDFVVAGTDTSLAVPVALMVDRGTRRVGERAKVFVHSGFKQQPILVTRWKRDRIVWQRIINESAVLDVPVKKSDLGGIGFSARFIRDHQLVELRQDIEVPWSHKGLDIRFSTFRDTLRPGQKERWALKVKTSDGLPAVGEVLAYMHDRSLDVFAPHTPPNPLALYQSNTLSRISSRSSLGRASVIRIGDQPRILESGHEGYKPTTHGDSPGRYRRRRGRRGRVMRADAAPRSARLGGKTRMSRKKRESFAEPESASDLSLAEEEPPADISRASSKSDNQALRTNFAETAFFRPQLLLNKAGEASIEFTVPDAVTSWHVYVHAMTKTFQYGLIKKEVRTVKEIMVRPYLPRFLREGDKAFLQVMVNNASTQPMSGTVDVDLIDPETEQSRLHDFGLTKKDVKALPFQMNAAQSATLKIAVKAPSDPGVVHVKVTASTPEFSDGELRALPILPGRMHLSQSKFVVLKDKEAKTVTFSDLADTSDRTRVDKSLVVTLDGQLFYGALSALPYLIDYPYECVEQTLNRFLPTGILTSLFSRYPNLKKVARDLAKRTTQLESVSAADANRKMLFEETPWLMNSRGGQTNNLLKVLDPALVKSVRTESLKKLRKAQLLSGGFPWFSGGKASVYMTLYIMYGFAKASEFGLDVPRNIANSGWRFLSSYVDGELMSCIAKDSCIQLSIYLNYILSTYTDSSWHGNVVSDEQRQMLLDHGFKHWKSQSKLVKAQLALTLKRMGREKDARLVWESVLDQAQTDAHGAVFWAPESKSWLWYQDTIEGHAMAIKATMEITPKSPKLEGMVLWLFLNKKLNQWKSTRATAEVLYVLAQYLEAKGQLTQEEETVVQIGPVVKSFKFESDTFTGGKNQIVLHGATIDPQKHSQVSFTQKSDAIQFASATWHFSTEKMPESAHGDFLTVKRRFFKRVTEANEAVLYPIDEGTMIAVGDEVEVHVEISSQHALEYVQLRAPRPAGFEPVSLRSGHRWGDGVSWYEEVRDSATNYFFERLPHGVYQFQYRLRASTSGTFKANPAVIQSVYSPEFVAYSAGRKIRIEPSMQGTNQ